MNEKDLSECRRLFNSVDTDNSGDIDIAEIQGLFKSLNHTISKEEVDQILKDHGLDKSGKIGFDEFCKLMETFLEQDTDFNDVFDEFDTDGDGHISKKELTTMLSSLGPYTQADIDLMFAQADMDGDGKITKDEFSRFFN
jgi:Ca2+-binding EF-hand superfamily protein